MPSHKTSTAAPRGFTALMLVAALSIASPAAAAYIQNLSFFSAGDIRLGSTAFVLDDESGFSSCCRNVVSVANGGNPSTISVRVRSDANVLQLLHYGVLADPVVAGLDHIALALNTGFSAGIVGREFNSVFTGFDESAVLSALLTQFNPEATLDDRIAAAMLAQNFQATLFGLNAGFGPTDAFALTSFTAGTSAGTGFATMSPIPPPPPPAVPEPSVWAMLIGGFALIGAAARRRRRPGQGPAVPA